MTITVPAVPGYGEAAPTPEPTVSPEPTEAPVETPAPTETPVPSTTPEAANTPEPTATPAPGSCASGIYNVTVNSSSSMFVAVSYTHLDVYKRQPCLRKSGSPAKR